MFKKIILPLILILLLSPTFSFAAKELDADNDGKIDSNLLPIDTTTTLGVSDTKIPSQNAVKIYSDTKAPINDPTFTGAVKGIISGTTDNCVKIGADGSIVDAGDVCGSGSGTGDITQSGSPANHYWAYFTADKTLTGVAITASKPVCSDADGNPAACAGTEGVWQVAGSYLTSANIAASISDSDTTHCPDGNSIYDALALKQNYSSVLAALAGIAITVDGNNVTFPGAIITTAEDGSRVMAILNNTSEPSLSANTYSWYFYGEAPYINVDGTAHKEMYEGGTFGGLIFGDSSPDAAGEIGYDGDLKWYDTASRTAVALDKIQTLTNKTLTSPVINGGTGTSLALTGNLTGLIPSIVVLKPSGTDSASSGAAFLTHADDSSTENAYVGMKLYNITDGSSCTVTASTSTTITCTLAGGTDNHWDSGNVYHLGPGPSQAGSTFYVGAGTLLWPNTAGYGSCVVAEGTASLKIDFPASMTFTGVLDKDVESTSAAEYIQSSGSTTDDLQCIHNKSATVAKGIGKRGTWTQE